MTASAQTAARTGDVAADSRAKTSEFEQIDAALDEILQARAVAMAQPAGVERCVRLAEVAEVEAAWWEELSERSRTRLYWRAVLAAREHAQHTARRWRSQAAAQQTPEAAPQPGAEVR